MNYTPRNKNGSNPEDKLFDALEPVAAGLGMAVVELNLFRSRGKVQARLVVTKPGAAPVGVDDCSRVHRGVVPRIELAFPGGVVYVEVTSPGINRVIKDASEFAYFTGRGVRCFRTDISDWSAGILVSAGTDHLILKRGDGELKLNYDIIAKAKLDDSLIGPVEVKS